jgi:hypothetical protein
MHDRDGKTVTGVTLYRLLVITGVVVFGVVGDLAAAQGTRAEELRAKREAKARDLRPAPRSAVERFLFTLEQRMLVERLLTPPRGVHLRLGGIGVPRREA